MIAVVDYGMGNLRSVSKAIEKLGGEVCVTAKSANIKQADKLVLPGVGNFGQAMNELKKRRLINPILDFIESRKSFLGICLGLQLLFDSSEESPKTKGFGVIRGTVKRFKQRKGFKIPQMGWNQVMIEQKIPLLDAVDNNSFFYFVHSYYALPAKSEKDVTIGITDYGIKFTSIIRKENIAAVQFHPEKSQSVGLSILKNFIEN